MRLLFAKFLDPNANLGDLRLTQQPELIKIPKAAVIPKLVVRARPTAPLPILDEPRLHALPELTKNPKRS
jgi:hypothetical protein